MSAPRSTCLPGRSTLAALAGATMFLALSAAACGPKFEDVEGATLQAILSAPIENGWVAVDSTQEGVRAVLQMEDEAERGELPWDLTELALLMGDDTIPPARMRCEASAVCRRVTRPVQVPNEREVAGPPDAVEEEVVLCTHVVRAEFVLPTLPTPADSVLLRLADTTTLLRWR